MTELLDAYYAEMDAIEAGYVAAKAEATNPMEHQLADVDRAFAQSAAKIRYDAAVEHKRSLASALADSEKARKVERRNVENYHKYRKLSGDRTSRSYGDVCTPEPVSSERLARIRALQAADQARYEAFCAKRAAEEAEAGRREPGFNQPHVVEGLAAAAEEGLVSRQAVVLLRDHFDELSAINETYLAVENAVPCDANALSRAFHARLDALDGLAAKAGV